MARPQKEGLQYFPVDVDIVEDDKLSVVVGKYGMLGLGIVVMLMARIYKNGYYYSWTEKEQYSFSSKVNVDINTVLSVVSECIKWGFFHQKLYEEHSILTSSGIQKRYLIATGKRVGVLIRSEYRLIPTLVSEEKTRVSAFGNGVSDINPSPESTQSKLNKKKVKRKQNKEPTARDKKDYPEDSPPYKMAQYLHQKIMEHVEESGVGHLVARSNLQTWADDCRKLLEIDKVDKALIRDVIDWSTSHDFWKKNILSASKLRSKFANLAIEMHQDKKPDPSGNRNGNSKKEIPKEQQSLTARFAKS